MERDTMDTDGPVPADSSVSKRTPDDGDGAAGGVPETTSAGETRDDTRPDSGDGAARGVRGPVVSRRTLLVAGGSGLVIVAGGAVLVGKHEHTLSRVLAKVRQHLPTVQQLPTPHPQPLPDGPMSTPRDVVIFDGQLASGWQDWSWGTHRIGDTHLTYAGHSVISIQLENWDGLQLVSDAHDATGLGYVQCWARSAGGDGQVANLTLITDNGKTSSAAIGDYTQGGRVTQGAWHLVRVPLTALQFDADNVQGLVLQAGAQQSQGTLYLADLRIVYSPDPHPGRVAKAWAYDLGTITLAFDHPMEAASVTNAAIYLLNAAGGTTDPAYPAAHPVAPRAVRYHPAARTVSLALPAPLQAGGTYDVTLGSVVDTVGVTTPAGTRTSVRVTAQPLTVALDAGANRRPISPDIYGSAGVGGADAADLGVTLSRWGGNAVTRYNWKLGNAFNAARDYHFQNGNYGATSPQDRQPSGVADQSIADCAAHNVGFLLTVPTIGWVARDDNSNTASTNVPDQGAPPLVPNGSAIAGYDPTANRQRTCVPSRARKGAPFSDPPDLSDPSVAQDEWVNHLVRRFGRAADGGVRYYAMDNEPDIWWVTHTDIRPAQLSYDQMRDTFWEYASAIKDVDPTAQITGPVSWGWPNYFYSPLDHNTDNYRTHADRSAHGDMPFLAWWLAEIRRRDEAAGRRTLDVLDLHFYPQGGEYSDDTSRDMAALRLRSTRGLWDPTYVDESWIGQAVRLIPRMREWVDLNYPGTKIALTEWNWGAEGSVNGALALADVLGIFGREGLDMACHWSSIGQGTPAYAAFKLYGNYDGNGGSFTGTSFAAESANADLLSCFATQTADNRALLLMVINKSPDSDLSPELRLANVSGALGGATPRRARVWRYWPGDAQAITPGPDLDLAAAGTSPLTLNTLFPASSLTLIRLEAGA